MSEVQRARAVEYAMNEFIERVDKAGYSASTIMNPIKKKHNRWVIGDSNSHLKQQLDDDFKVDMSDFEQVNRYCEGMYETC